MRAIPTLLTATLCACAFGQITLAEKPIQDAFAALRMSDTLVLQLEGTDQLDSRTNSIVTTAFWSWEAFPSTATFAKADIFEFLNGVSTRRICADGTTVWGYDYRQNTYTNSRYGAYGGAPPKEFRQTMLQAITTSSQGPTVFVARMLREIFGGEFANYRTWLPGASIETIGDAQQKQDPVSRRWYVGSQKDFYILYTYPGRGGRSNAFHFHREDATKPYYLANIYYTDVQSVRNSPRVLDWRILVNPITGSTTNYQFVPPRTAKAIANLRTNSGG